MAEDEREQRLRKKAEKLVGADLASLEDLTPDQMRGLIHELQVQQIELQMQNEELRQAQAELERSRNRYFELYDLAPVAYLTVDQEGVILQANLRAGDLLGHQRSHLIRRKFTDFVVISDQASWIAHLQTVTESGERRFCELNLMRRDGAVVTVHLDTLRVGDDENEKPFELRTSMTEITQRKEAEEALREAHERAKWMARFPEENPNPVARASADGIVLYRNPAAAELAGWACEVGKPLPELLLPIVARGMAEGQDAQQDVQLGGRFYSVWVAPFPQESYANVYGRDITDRRRAEQERERLLALVQERNAEMDAVFAAMQDAVVIYDTDMNVRRVNPIFIPTYGFDPVGLNVRDMIQRTQCRWLDGRPFRLEEQPTPRALRGETVLNQRFLITGLDGAEMALETSSGPLYVGDRVLGTVTVWHDITERKRTEEALQKSLRRFELLAETAGELLRIPEPQNVVDSLCRRVMTHLDCHAFFNFLVDEQAGRLHLNACAGIPPEEARRIEWLDYGVAVCGCVARDRCRIVAEHIPTTPDVRTELVKSYGIKAYACHPLLGAGGRLIGTLSFGTRSRETFSPDDLSLMKAVTDQVAVAMIRMQDEQALRASEEALRQANEQLEERVRERTEELTALNESLMETRYQLRSLASDLVLTEARERRTLASELHDTVAQMLAIAKLTLESTGARLEGKSREEVKRAVQLLQEASRQTRSLMADLSPSLLYEAGLGQALRALARRMGELHSLAIEVVDDGSPKPLGEDYRVLLFRAVQELLHNTVKHAKATKVKVSLQREGEQVRIEVEDDGVGFLVSPRGRGDGMRGGFGLFSIQERLRHLGGSFEIFSQPGRGVRAVLFVPLQVEGEAEGRAPALVRILIAEDHKIMRDALASLLEKEPGFEVVGLAADGLEAVRLAREVKPDVVLMDVNMPRMDGIEATQQITAELPEIKVVGLSVQAEGEIASAMLAAGASSFVAKSASPAELTETIRAAVGSIE